MFRLTWVTLRSPAVRTPAQGQQANTEPVTTWSGNAHLRQLTASQTARSLGPGAERVWTCSVRLPLDVKPTDAWTLEGDGRTFAIRNVSESLFWTLDLQEL